MNWLLYVLLGLLGLSIGLNVSLWKLCKLLKIKVRVWEGPDADIC